MPSAATAPANATPANASASGQDAFLASLRLGWAMAETRGRYRIGDDPARLGRAPPIAALRTGNALPLAGERSPAEQRIEAEAILKALAGSQALDPPCSELTGQPKSVANDKASARLTELAKALARAHDPASADSAWREFTDFIYGWDAYIQDAAAARTFGTSSAYQLGRGLSEIFWALDPTAAADSPQAWEFLLGDERRTALKTLLARLSEHFVPLSSDAVSWSMDSWAAVVRDPAWRGDGSAASRTETIRCLAVQNLLWRDLLITGRDPRDLVAPADLLRRARRLWPVVRAFLPEVVVLGGGVLFLTEAAHMLSGNGGTSSGAVLAVIGATGVSGAGLAAKAKEAAHQVLEHLRVELDREVVRAAITVLPTQPHQRRGLRGRRAARVATT